MDHMLKFVIELYIQIFIMDEENVYANLRLKRMTGH